MEVHHAYNWRGGVTPGEPGSALITGHAYARGHSQFNQMPGVQPGNLIRIITPTHAVETFRVTSVNRHAPHVLPEEMIAKFRSELGPPRIVIYTCNARTYNSSGYHDGDVIQAKLIKR